MGWHVEGVVWCHENGVWCHNFNGHPKKEMTSQDTVEIIF